MANAKKIIRIVGIILLVIGLFIIFIASIFSTVLVGRIYILIYIITGVFLFVIGIVFLMASRKKILAANAKKIAGIVLLVIGSIYLVFIYYVLGAGGFILTTFIGVVCIFPGLILLLTSRKKYSKSPDK